MKALHTPCHTQDSICFLFEDGDQRAVFTGDTLFIGGTSKSQSPSRVCSILTILQDVVVSSKATLKRWTRRSTRRLPLFLTTPKSMYVIVSCFHFAHVLNSTAAWPRIHQGQRQIRHQGLAVRACQAARGFHKREQADARQVHYW